MKRLFYSILFAGIMLFAMAVTCNATTYYVSNTGNDNNSGTSEEQAWRSLERASSVQLKPGDSLLLECGSVWNEPLFPKGEGTKEAPIVLGSYGAGKKPLINGGGISGLHYGGTVSLYNQSYWTIQDIEVTNISETMAWRTGISVYFEDTIGYGITIKNVTVHDVMGGVGESGVRQMNTTQWCSGISVRAITPNKVTTYVDDVLIENCEVYDVRRSGITVESNFNSAIALLENSYSHNVTVRNNTVHNIWGDGIVLAGVENGLVEHNVAYDTNLMSMNGSPAANVGIWGIHSNDLTFRYNESYLCHTTHDGYGFDIDGDNNNIVMEHNYSHDNDGGFMLLVNYRNNNFTIRHNISQNDHQWFIACAHFPESPSSFWNISGKIYNNTFYSKERGLKYILMLGRPKSMEVYNNIFYSESDEISEIPCTYPLNVKRRNNLYYFGSSEKPMFLEEEGAIIGKNPLFVAAGSGKNGRNSVDGYKLFEDSPALGAGILVEDNGGVDYFGNPVSDTVAPNIGAYNGMGISYDAQDMITLARNNDIHLTIGANKMIVKGEELIVDERDKNVAPFILDGKTMVPVRAICNALDAEVTWNYEESSTVIDSFSGEIQFKESDDFYVSNGMSKKWSESPVVINNIMYVPLRDICREFGESIVWNNGEIHITDNMRVYK